MHSKVLNIYRSNKVIFNNFSFITLMQMFLMLVPLITYPYLIRVLGTELYGYVITAQVVASYFSIIVDFGFKGVSARHISIYRNNKERLSEIMSAILLIRCFLWLISFIIYLGIVYSIGSYREYFWLFIFSFGITFNELLFPQFFFQGIERMKSITIINIIIRTVFVALIFIFISSKDDYLYVPLFLAIGYFLGGVISLYIIFTKYKLTFVKPKLSQLAYYYKDALPIFYTDIICTVKDKLSYILIGQFIGMSEVTIYDLGAKFVRLIAKPTSIITTVLLPRIAKNKDIKLFKRGALFSFGISVFIVIFVNCFLSDIVKFFMNDSIDLFPIRLFLIAPLILSISTPIASNLMISLGYNKYILYSIVITTLTYSLCLMIFYYVGYITITSLILVSVIAYLAEFVYRLLKSNKIIKNERKVK